MFEVYSYSAKKHLVTA